MTWLQAWQTAVIASWTQVSTAFLLFTPRFIGAVVIFAIGIFIASWAKRLIGGALKIVRFDEFSKNVGFSDFLARAEIKMTPSLLLGEVVRWILILVFFIAAVDLLGLTAVSAGLGRILGYIPNVLAAALILGAGYIVANFVQGLVRGAFATIDHEASRPVGKLARWVVLIVAFFAAIGQLQIAPQLTGTFFQGLTWTLVLVFGLSIGLGSKDLVAKVLEDWYKKISK